VILLKNARVASFWHRIAFNSTGTIEVVLIDANSLAIDPFLANQRDEKSHPDSAPDAMLVKNSE